MSNERTKRKSAGNRRLVEWRVTWLIEHMPIEREYPVNLHGIYKNYMAKAFYRSFKMANEIVSELEQFLISTPKNKVNW